MFLESFFPFIYLMFVYARALARLNVRPKQRSLLWMLLHYIYIWLNVSAKVCHLTQPQVNQDSTCCAIFYFEFQ